MKYRIVIERVHFMNHNALRSPQDMTYIIGMLEAIINFKLIPFPSMSPADCKHLPMQVAWNMEPIP